MTEAKEPGQGGAGVRETAGLSAKPLPTPLERAMPLTLMGMAVVASLVCTAVWVGVSVLERVPAFAGPRADGYLFVPLVLGLNATLLWLGALPVQAGLWRLPAPVRLLPIFALQVLLFGTFYHLLERLPLDAGLALEVLLPPALFVPTFLLLERFRVEGSRSGGRSA